MTETVIIAYATPGKQRSPAEIRGKFVQLRLHNQECLVFAPRDLHQYHNQILAHFLGDRGIAHWWLDKQTLDMEAPALRIIGGGRFRLDPQRQILELWDNSQAYGRFDAMGLPERIAEASHPWSGYQVRVF